MPIKKGATWPENLLEDDSLTSVIDFGTAVKQSCTDSGFARIGSQVRETMYEMKQLLELTRPTNG